MAKDNKGKQKQNDGVLSDEEIASRIKRLQSYIAMQHGLGHMDVVENLEHSVKMLEMERQERLAQRANKLSAGRAPESIELGKLDAPPVGTPVLQDLEMAKLDKLKWNQSWHGNGK